MHFRRTLLFVVAVSSLLRLFEIDLIRFLSLTRHLIIPTAKCTLQRKPVFRREHVLLEPLLIEIHISGFVFDALLNFGEF